MAAKGLTAFLLSDLFVSLSFLVLGFMEWWGLIVRDAWIPPLLIGMTLDLSMGILLALHSAKFKWWVLCQGCIKKLGALVVVAMAFAAQRIYGQIEWGHWTALAVFLTELKSVGRNATAFGLPGNQLIDPILRGLEAALSKYTEATRTAKDEIHEERRIQQREPNPKEAGDE